MSSRTLLPSLLAVTLSVTGLLLPDRASAAPACREGDQARVWTAPLRPAPGEPFEVLAVATDGALDQLLVTDPAGSQTSLRGVPYGGPPWGLHGGVFRPKSGTYRIEASRGGRVVACTEVKVGGGGRAQGTGEWDLATQALYAVWIERLFDAPPAQSLSFDSLAPVLRDPQRNFLHNYLDANEDARLPAEPDCADLPYFLRAYFAWKLGLPIAYRPCNRGSRNSAPRCEGPTINDGFTGAPVSAQAFARGHPADHGRGPLRQRAHRPARRDDRSVSGPAPTHGPVARHRLCRPLWSCHDPDQVDRRSAPASRGCCSRSTPSRTTRSPANASGRGPSCSPRPRAPAPASSSSGRCCAPAGAACNPCPTAH